VQTGIYDMLKARNSSKPVSYVVLNKHCATKITHLTNILRRNIFNDMN